MATVASTTRFTPITLASDSAGPFNVGFRIFETDSLTVYVDGETRADWTLTSTLTDNPGGYDDAATITFDDDISSGSVIWIEGTHVPEREDDYSATEPRLTDKMNAELPRLWTPVIEAFDRTLKSLRATTRVPPLDLSEVDDVVLKWKDDRFQIGPSVTEIEAAADEAAAAAASAAAAAASAEAAEEAAANVYFESLAAAEAAEIPPEKTVVWAKVGDFVVGYERRSGYTCFTDTLGATWGPLSGGRTLFEHWGIETTHVDPDDLIFDSEDPVTHGTLLEGTADYTDLINAAMAEHEGVIEMMGCVRHGGAGSGAIQWRRTCSVVNGTGTNRPAGFVVCQSDYDDSITHFHVGDTGDCGMAAENILFYAEQPHDATVREDLIRYPWSIDLNNAARPKLHGCRLAGYVNGIDMRNASGSPSNAGGAVLDHIEDGCFGIGVLVDEVYDYVDLSEWRSWPYEMVGFSGLLDTWNDGQTFGPIVQRCDGFSGTIRNWTSRAMFGRNALTKLVLTGDIGWLDVGEAISQISSGATGTVEFIVTGPVTEVYLRGVTGTWDTTNRIVDGDTTLLGAESVPTAVTSIDALDNRKIAYKAEIHLDDSDSFLSLRGGAGQYWVYSSKIEAELASSIDCRGGRHIVTPNLRSSTEDAIYMEGAGADLTIMGGWIRSEVADKRMGRVVSGRLTFQDVLFQWPDTASQTVPFIDQTAGQLQVLGCRTDQMINTRPVVAYNTDSRFNHCADNSFGPHAVTYNTGWLLGRYEGTGVSHAPHRTSTSFVTSILSDVATAAHNFVTQRGRGTPESPANLVDEDRLFSQTWQGRVNGAWQDLIQLRGRMDNLTGTVGRGLLSIAAANIAGTLQTVLQVTGDAIKALKPITGPNGEALLHSLSYYGDGTLTQDNVDLMEADVGYVRITGQMTATAAVTISAPLFMETPGARIIADDATVSIKDDITAPKQWIFQQTGTGSFELGRDSGGDERGEGNREVLVEWFGAYAHSGLIDPGVDMATFIGYANDALGNAREGVIHFGNGNYYMESGVPLNRGVHAKGLGRRRTVFRINGDGYVPFTSNGDLVKVTGANFELFTTSISSRNSPFVHLSHEECEIHHLRGNDAFTMFVMSGDQPLATNLRGTYSQNYGAGSSILAIRGPRFTAEKVLSDSGANYAPEALINIGGSASQNVTNGTVWKAYSRNRAIPVKIEATGGAVRDIDLFALQNNAGGSVAALVDCYASGSNVMTGIGLNGFRCNAQTTDIMRVTNDGTGTLERFLLDNGTGGNGSGNFMKLINNSTGAIKEGRIGGAVVAADRSAYFAKSGTGSASITDLAYASVTVDTA